MGGEINTAYEEYGITISGNRDKVIITSKRKLNPNYKRGINSQFNEDLYFSIRADEEKWNPLQEVNNLNTQYNEGSPYLSADGNTLFFARCYSPDGFGNCDLYSAKRLNDSTWTDIRNLGEAINSTAWDSHPALSVSGDTLFFASDRAGSFGGTDLYFSVKDKLGNWSTSKNMGPVINTRRNEVSPYIHPSFHVLYFSSDGELVNFGDFDIFKTYLRGGQWTEPFNVGPLVNGKGSEFYFTIDSAAQKLFYAKSEPETPDNLDLFSFPLPMEAQPHAVVRFTGRVTEESTGEVFEGIVSVIDLDERTEVAPKYLREDGSFHFDLIKDRRYMLVVQGENFFRIEEIFFLDQEKEMNIAAKSIKTVRFESLEFENGKADLLPEMENDLHLIVDFLVDHPDFSITISGHTDSGGNPDWNIKLSQQRADNIREYILSYGKIDGKRIKAYGKGSTEPIVPVELNEEHKRLNRRVEFVISKTKSEDG
jgi:outer membrane protein OmpA-like peptidoglycan-associated protein